MSFTLKKKISVNNSGVGRGLGIAGFVVGIIALLLSFIPCTGVLAFFPGIIALGLSATGLGLTVNSKGSKGLIIAALIISITGTGNAIYKYYMIKQGIETFGSNVSTFLNSIEYTSDTTITQNEDILFYLDSLNNIDETPID